MIHQMGLHAMRKTMRQGPQRAVRLGEQHLG